MMSGTKDKRRPATTKPPPRGSLKDFIDEDLNTEVYGEKKIRESRSDRNRHEKQTKIIKASLSFGQLRVDDRALYDECNKSFRQRWFLRDSKEVLFTHHLDRIDIFDVPEVMVKRHQSISSRPSTAAPITAGSDDIHHSAAFITNVYNSAVVQHMHEPKQLPQSLQPYDALDHYDSIVESVTAASTVFDPKKPLRIVLSDRMKTQYEMRVQERQLISMEMINKADSNDIWRNADKLKKVSANDILFLECLRLHVLPYPIRSLHSVVDQVINRTVTSNSIDSNDLDDSNNNSNNSGSQVRIGRNIAEVLPNNILTLDLTDRSIGNERAICLAEALIYCPTLTTLLIPNNRLEDSVASKLLDSLFYNTQVTHIDMSENALGLMCSTMLANCFENPKRNLQRLNLNNCGFTDKHCHHLAKSIISNRTLLDLDLSSNNIGTDEDKYAHVFATLLQANRVLQRLNLANNFLRRKAVRELLLSLTYNQSLLQLSLSKNQVADDDILHAACDIEKNVTLTNLDLSHNFIASKGCVILTYAFSHSKSSMRWLNLNDNPIGPIAFAFAMKMMRKVVILSQHSSFQHSTPIATSHHIHSSKQQSHNLEADDEDQSPPQPLPNSQRILHIACEPKKVNEDQLLQLTNIIGHYEFDLSSAYDRTIVRFYLDELECHPFGEVKEIKWSNSIVHSYEYPVLTRHTNTHSAAVNRTVAPESGNGGEFYHHNLSALQQVLHIHIPQDIKLIFETNKETIKAWQREHNYSNILLYLIETILPFVVGNVNDISAPVLLQSRMHLPFQDHKNVVNIHLTAMEEINRWLSEANIFGDQNSLERNKFCQLLIDQLLISSLDTHSTPLLAQHSHNRYVVPQTGILHINIKIPLYVGIKSLQFPTHALHTFLENIQTAPKQYYQLASYLYRILETKIYILNLRFDDAELVLKILLRVNIAHHLDIIEKLLYQIDSVYHVRKFLVRNLYFHEIVMMRKKMNFAFKCITGNVTGHYCFDLSDSNHWHVLLKLIAYHNYERRLYPCSQEMMQDGHHPNFRNATLNGSYIALTADWLQQAPNIGKLRFDYVSYNPTANIMSPSMQVLTGNYSTLQATDAAIRLRKQAFVDVMITNIFSKDLFKKYAHVMRKRNLQPKNINGNIAVFALLKSGLAADEHEDQEEDDNSFENSSDEDQGPSQLLPSAPSSPKATAKQMIKSEHTSFLRRRMNAISKGSFLDLKDQSEDIDTGNRGAFLRINNNDNAAPPMAMPSSSDNNNAAQLAGKILQKAKGFYEKKFYSENSNLWRDCFETSWRKYLKMNRHHLIKTANEIYHNILRDTQNTNTSPGHGKIDRDSFPEEVYLAYDYQNSSKLPIYQTFELATVKKSNVMRSPDRSPTSKFSAHGGHSHSPNDHSQVDKQKQNEAESLARMHACFPFDMPLLILECFLLYHVYLDSLQVELILNAFKEKDAPFLVLIRVVSVVWMAVTDKENLGQVIFKVLGDKVYDECVHRLGYTALWSPLHPAGKYAFDLAAADHRHVLSSLLHLLVEDKSLELEECEYQNSGLQSRHAFDLRKHNTIQDIPHQGQLIIHVIQQVQADEDEFRKRQEMVRNRTFFRQVPPLNIPHL